MPGFKGFREMVVQNQAKKLAKNIDKESFLRQLEVSWAPYIGKDSDIEEEVRKARERMDKSSAKVAFDTVGITDDDLRKVIKVIQESPVQPKIEPIRGDRVGRNWPCPCGSGKKYKKCCGR
jgi:uncharacterized protein YecA (UPF0149 family)